MTSPCIANEWRCDHVIDCVDGSDEKNCLGKIKLVQQMQCQSKHIIISTLNKAYLTLLIILDKIFCGKYHASTSCSNCIPNNNTSPEDWCDSPDCTFDHDVDLCKARSKSNTIIITSCHIHSSISTKEHFHYPLL